MRVDSLSQGATPLKVNFMRPITDEEWFTGLESGSHGRTEELGKNRRRKTQVREGAEKEELEGGDYAVSLFVTRSLCSR